MKRLHRTSVRERGSVAVELAILLVFVLPPLLAAPLFYGRVLWHYTVAEKAVHDAARFLAAAPPGEMKMAGLNGEVLAVTAARSLAEQEIAELNTGGYAPTIGISCDGLPFCAPNKPLPQLVTVALTMTIEDPFFGGIIAEYFGQGNAISIPLDPVATFNYVGN
jgi:hypothetical protein